MNVKRHLIFCGRLGSGKSTVSKYVAARMGANWNGFGSTVARIAKEQNIPITREQLQKLGAELVAKSPDLFCHRVLSDAGYKGGQIIVLDGLRHQAILLLLRQILAPDRLLCIFVDTQEAVRFARIAARDRLSTEGVRQLDMHSTEVEVVKALRSNADFIVDNSKSSEEAANTVVHWISKNANSTNA